LIRHVTSGEKVTAGKVDFVANLKLRRSDDLAMKNYANLKILAA